MEPEILLLFPQGNANCLCPKPNESHRLPLIPISLKIRSILILPSHRPVSSDWSLYLRLSIPNVSLISYHPIRVTCTFYLVTFDFILLITVGVQFSSLSNFFPPSSHYIPARFIERLGRAVNTLTSYLGDPGLYSRFRRPVILIKVFRMFPQPLQENVWIVPSKYGHDRFLPNPVQFITIHLSFFNEAI
jgi:hypothetical protein